MSNRLFLQSKVQGLFLMASLGFFGSCVDGFKGSDEFTSSVQGVTLVSPSKEAIVVSPNPTGTTLNISWPVVHGAGGYQFSLYIVDDPTNPIVVGDENEVIDGCSASRPLQEDTKYQVVVKTLGNEKYNNKEAAEATEVEYSSLVPTFATIPAGSDLAEWFAANPIPSDNPKTELAYVLEADGAYTLSAPIDFGNQLVTFRGEKVGRATITYGEEGRIMTTAGLKMKFINFDCSALPSGSSTSALLTLSSTPDPAILGTGDYYIIMDPIVIQECEVKGIPRHILYDNGKKYCPAYFVINNCVIELNIATSNRAIYFAQGFINELTIDNSTIYNVGATANNYFIQYSSSGRPDRAGFVTGALNLKNSTWYNVAYGQQMANYSGFSRNSIFLNLTNNIFMNCGRKGEVARRIMAGGRNMVSTFGNNSYWFDGEYATGEESWDSGTILDTDPSLRDPQSGDFTVQGAAQIALRTGDPRWLPLLEQ